MLKILYDKVEISDESRAVIDSIFAEVAGNEELTEEQTERITTLLEAEAALSETVAGAYEDIEKKLGIAIGGLEEEGAQ